MITGHNVIYLHPAQHQLHLTAFGADLREPFGRKSDFTLPRLAKIVGR
jgi:hypothetical protein